MSKEDFENLIITNGGRCLWEIKPRNMNFKLEFWQLNDGKQFLKQIWKHKGGEVHYKPIEGMHFADTAKALGLIEGN